MKLQDLNLFHRLTFFPSILVCPLDRTATGAGKPRPIGRFRRDNKRRCRAIIPTPQNTQAQDTYSTLKNQDGLRIMGLAHFICCVGGLFSCIGPWGAGNTSRPASYYLGFFIVPPCRPNCKGVFVLTQQQGRISGQIDGPPFQLYTRDGESRPGRVWEGAPLPARYTCRAASGTGYCLPHFLLHCAADCGTIQQERRCGLWARANE